MDERANALALRFANRVLRIVAVKYLQDPVSEDESANE